MNIFILDWDVNLSAQYHCNKHVTKMVLEYTQILSTVNRSLGMDEGYKMTHINHPCVAWARECLDNWYYLRNLCEALNREFYFRRGKIHRSWEVARILNVPDLPLRGNITRPALAMPEDVKCDDVVESYRNYYRVYKKDILDWNPRENPYWI